MKPIPSCPEYFACDAGHIWRNGKRLAEGTNGRGYHRVAVSIQGEVSDKYVHRLVCEAYKGAPPSGHECRHRDGIRAHNVPDNLDWATKAVNEADKIAHGTVVSGERNGQAKLTAVIVIEARRRVAAGEQIKDVAADLQMRAARIRDAVRGKRWRHLPGIVDSNRITAARYVGTGRGKAANE